MRRYTTPTLPLTIDDIDFSEVSVFRVSIEQDKIELLKVINGNDPHVDADHKTIYVPLTQEETASFCEGYVAIQVRFKYNNNSIDATDIVNEPIERVLDEVII